MLLSCTKCYNKHQAAEWISGEDHFGFMILAYQHSRFEQRADLFEKTDHNLRIFPNSTVVIDPFRK